MAEPQNTAFVSEAKSPAREAVLVFATVAIATFGITRLQFVPLVSDYVAVGVAILFLGVAIKMVQRIPGGLERAGMQLGGVLEPVEASLGERAKSSLREIGAALTMAAIVFPPFIAGFYFYNAPTHAFHWAPSLDFVSFSLNQIVLVGLPEEAFFRGYLQTRLRDAWPAQSRVLRVPVSVPAILVQAVLFAVVHYIVDFHPARLAVFFPALLFGWIREWRGGIGAALLFHAMCNMLSNLLAEGWF